MSYPSAIEGKINHIVRSAAGVVGVISPSGWIGKWGSAGAIETFTEQRWISVQKTARQYPF